MEDMDEMEDIEAKDDMEVIEELEINPPYLPPLIKGEKQNPPCSPFDKGGKEKGDLKKRKNPPLPPFYKGGN